MKNKRRLKGKRSEDEREGKRRDGEIRRRRRG